MESVQAYGGSWCSSESLLFEPVQDGLDPLDGLLAGQPYRVQSLGLHGVQLQQLFSEQFLQVAVTLVHFFAHKLVNILLEQKHSGHDLLDLGEAGIIAQGLGPYLGLGWGWRLGAWSLGSLGWAKG